MKRHAWIFALCVVLSFPAAAQARRGFASTGINLRAGPDIGYPIVDYIPAGARLFVHGCTFDWSWCDVSVFGERGWVGGDFIDYPYDQRWVSVYRYGGLIGIPVVSFVIGNYWRDHYRHRHFYRDRDYWYRHRFTYHRVPRYGHGRDRGRHAYRHHRGDRNGYGYRGHDRGGQGGGDYRQRHRDHAPRARQGINVGRGFQNRRDPHQRRLARSVREAARPQGGRARYRVSHAPSRSYGISRPRMGGNHHGQPRRARTIQGHAQRQAHGRGHRNARHDGHHRHGRNGH